MRIEKFESKIGERLFGCGLYSTCCGVLTGYLGVMPWVMHPNHRYRPEMPWFMWIWCVITFGGFILMLVGGVIDDIAKDKKRRDK